MENIALLGSTGSVGKQVLQVLRSLPGRYKVLALAANRNVSELSSQIKEFSPEIAGISDSGKKEELERLVFGNKTKIVSGKGALAAIAKNPKTDCLAVCTSGTASLQAVLQGIREKKKILIANKESLIAGGELINKALLKYKTELLPLDSEHSAIFQCLKGEEKKEIKNLILTCSGGPFLGFSRKKVEKAKLKDVLSHPVWKMGPKITVDSATLMNKGFEVLEAHYLFKIPLERIKILVHPECLIHSMVEFQDGTIKAQLSLPDMKFPIQYALFHPERIPSSLPSLNLEGKKLSFFKPDRKLFPCLDLAYKAGRTGGTMPSALVASDQKAVEMFMKGKIKFGDIPKVIEKILKKHRPIKNPSLKEVLETEAWVKKQLEK